MLTHFSIIHLNRDYCFVFSIPLEGGTNKTKKKKKESVKENMSSKKIEPLYPSPFGKEVKHHEQPISKDKEKDKDKKRKTLLRGKKKKKPTKLENVYSGSTGLVTSIKKREYSEEPSTFNISGHNFKCLIDENVKQKKCNFCKENFTTEAYICKNMPCGYEAHWNCLASQIPVCQASTHFQKQRTFTTTDDFRNSPKSARSATGPSAWGQFSQSDRFLVDDPNDHKQSLFYFPFFFVFYFFFNFFLFLFSS